MYNPLKIIFTAVFFIAKIHITGERMKAVPSDPARSTQTLARFHHHPSSPLVLSPGLPHGENTSIHPAI